MSDALSKAQDLERRAKEKRDEEKAKNRRRFPILCDPIVADLCERFSGRVVYVRNNDGEEKGGK